MKVARSECPEIAAKPAYAGRASKRRAARFVNVNRPSRNAMVGFGDLRRRKRELKHGSAWHVSRMSLRYPEAPATNARRRTMKAFMTKATPVHHHFSSIVRARRGISFLPDHFLLPALEAFSFGTAVSRIENLRC